MTLTRQKSSQLMFMGHRSSQFLDCTQQRRQVWRRRMNPSLCLVLSNCSFAVNKSIRSFLGCSSRIRKSKIGLMRNNKSSLHTVLLGGGIKSNSQSVIRNAFYGDILLWSNNNWFGPCFLYLIIIVIFRD